jgi:DNA-3-methyladenine glycosylase
VSGRRLGRTFFRRPTERLARDLLGCVLVHGRGTERVAGRIVETEAYLASGDPASHSHRGPTRRNASMFGRPGLAYVYLIYGMHHCLNVVSAEDGVGEAVLIRALEPLAGLDVMRARRGGVRDRELCRGPGKLAQAFGLTLEHDGLDLCRGPLGVWPGGGRWGALPEAADIEVGPRVGIRRAADLPLRFRVGGSEWTSR